MDSFFSPSRKYYTAPTPTTFRNILADLPPETPPAMDGKDIRVHKIEPMRNHESGKPKRSA